jgi:hypothetical protein
MVKYSILFFTALLLANNTNAQKLQLGLEAGVSTALTTEQFQFVGSITKNNIRIGGRFGLPAALYLSDKLRLNSGIYWTMKGNTKYYSNSSVEHPMMSISYSTLEIPLCITYMNTKPNKNKFFIGIGPYIGYGLYGKLRYYDENGAKVKQAASWGNTPGKNDIKHLDLGVQLQTGIVLKNGLVCRFLLQQGLNDMAASKEGYYNSKHLLPGSFTQIKNQIYTSLSVAYFLKHKNKH